MTFETATITHYAVKITTNGSHSSTGWRINDSTFTGFHYAILTNGTLTGVIDNNNFRGGGIMVYGDLGTAWAADTDFGTANFVFIENNYFTDVGAVSRPTNAVIAYDGARIVVRYNDMFGDGPEVSGLNASMGVDAHGYGHGTNTRSTRAYEIYNNHFITSSFYSETRALFLRGGTGVVYNNKFDDSANPYTSAAIDISEYRIRTSAVGTGRDSPGGDCDTALCYPTYYKVQVNDASVFAEGDTITGETSGASGTLLALATTGNNYIYFASVSSGPFQSGETVNDGVDTAVTQAAQATVNGEGYPCCDQIGRGKDRALEPYYFWGNVDEASVAVKPRVDAVPNGYIVEDRDYRNAEYPYTAYTCPHPATGLPGRCVSSTAGRTGYNVPDPNAPDPSDSEGSSSGGCIIAIVINS